MYKEDLALNNLQWLICHKTKPNETKIFDSPSYFVHTFLIIYYHIFSGVSVLVMLHSKSNLIMIHKLFITAIK